MHTFSVFRLKYRGELKGGAELERKYKIMIFGGALLLAAAVNPELAFRLISGAFQVFRPIIIGMAAAFVINRPVCKIYELCEKLSDQILSRSAKRHYTAFNSIARITAEKHKARWVLSVTLGYILLVSVAAAAVGIIIPQILDSVKILVSNSDIYFDRIKYFYSRLSENDKLGIIPAVGSIIEKAGEKLPEIAADFYGKTAGFVGFLTDFFIGIVISIYILIAKDKLRSIVRRISQKIMSEQRYKRYAKLYYTVYEVFSRFVSGQITEAAILGGLCYVGMKLFRFDYALLISFIIGITALLPVVGAIIGTIPCAFLLFLVKPISAVWFVVFIIVLQQLENNLIYPKVVGKSMGLPPLPVLIAILIGAKLGGCVGILLAVPITSVLYGIIKEKLDENRY